MGARFEATFKSSTGYDNPLEQASLFVDFVSPAGETNRVEGFWDGGRTWRVRFTPWLAGHWTFKTTCSDAHNKGLSDQSGEFECTATAIQTRFGVHGPLRAARDGSHFEQRDGAPFYWLADTAWNGPRLSKPDEWEFYCRTRHDQGFTVVAWSALAPADKASRPAAVVKGRLVLEPKYFQQLDARVETLRRADLLSAINPLPDLDARSGLPAFTTEQAALIIRYVAARWGGEPVAFLLSAGGDSDSAARCEQIGRAITSDPKPPVRGPVIVLATGNPSVLAQFHDEKWVSAFGVNLTPDKGDDVMRKAMLGLRCPVIRFFPPEDSLLPDSEQRFGFDDVRRALYSSQLAQGAAGVCYSARGVADWDRSVFAEDRGAARTKQTSPLWRKALFMPAATQMPTLSKFMNTIEFWQLRPQPGFVAIQPGGADPRRRVAAAATEKKDLVLFYVPQDRTLEVYLDAMPSAPTMNWLNPRTGEITAAVAVVGGSTCQIPTPEPGDWLLVLKGEK